MILELSGEYPVNTLCKEMGIQRSSFYYWKARLSDPAPRTRNLVSSIALFLEFHLKYPSHGYRWLNAKILLDTGLLMSDPFAHKCCKIAGIKSKSRHYCYRRPGDPYGTDIVYDEKGNRKKSTAPSGITGQSTYDPYNNVLTSCAPGRTSITNYHWGDTEAEKRKYEGLDRWQYSAVYESSAGTGELPVQTVRDTG